MAVFRVHKNKNYITMGKHHLKQKDMSLKAIGLLSIMLSLPEDWNYSVAGLTAIRSESKNTINAILQELEKFGYLVRTQIRNQNGIITGYNYDIYEEPYPKKPDMENPDLENRELDNWYQLNNKELNNKELNNKRISKAFQKPTREELEAYKKEKGLDFNPNDFIDYYESNGWKVGRNPMRDWKATARRWSSRRANPSPGWINENIAKEEMTKEELQEMEDLLKDFK